MVQYESVKVTFQQIEYIPRQATPSVSFQSKRLAAFCRTPKGRRQAESRHSCKAYFLTAPHSPIECEAALCKVFAPPNQSKNFPARQPPPKERGKSPQTDTAVAMQGSSGRVREVWRVGSPFQGDSLRLQGLSLSLPHLSQRGRIQVDAEVELLLGKTA